MRYLWFALLGMVLAGCGSPAENDPGKNANPPAEGFRMEASDSRAVALADSVMVAMGGRSAWDRTRFLGWNFFGFRYLVWDKLKGRIRIDSPRDSLLYLVDLADESRGQVFRKGVPVEDQRLRDSLLQRGKSIWINDSYWLVMPFKLKDSGVTLKYLGRDTTQAGAPAFVLQLAFSEVGDTPQNKYHVYVDTGSYLVRQWAYFPQAEDEAPAFILPWDDYREYGGILLSGSRGERGLSDIKVLDATPEGAFSVLDPMLPI